MSTVKIQGRRGFVAKATKAVVKNKPGRPEGDTGLKDDILDAAEILFSDMGYAGTTLREVADSAEVNQALINYYFGSKFGLFESVFLRRAIQISDDRLAHLRLLEVQGEYTVRDVVNAFLLPTIQLRSTKGGKAFIRLQARLHTEPPEISYGLRHQAYDSSTGAFYEAFCKVLPNLSRKDVHWRVTLMIGAYMYAFSDTHRLEETASDVCDPEDTDEVFEQVVNFVSAGMNA